MTHKWQKQRQKQRTFRRKNFERNWDLKEKQSACGRQLEGEIAAEGGQRVRKVVLTKELLSNKHPADAAWNKKLNYCENIKEAALNKGDEQSRKEKIRIVHRVQWVRLMCTWLKIIMQQEFKRGFGVFKHFSVTDVLRKNSTLIIPAQCCSSSGPFLLMDGGQYSEHFIVERDYKLLFGSVCVCVCEHGFAKGCCMHQCDQIKLWVQLGQYSPKPLPVTNTDIWSI